MVLLVFSLLSLVFAQTATQAANRTWKGTVSSDWTTAENWDPAGIPSASDTVTISGGAAVSLSANATITGLILNGSISGPGILNVQSVMTWTGGNVSSTLMIPPGAQLTISGDADKSLAGGVIQNSGAILWMGAGRLIGYGAGSIQNSGTFEAQNDSSFDYCCSGDPATFHNTTAGTFRKSHSSGATTFGGCVLVNEGRVDVQTGAVVLAGQNHQLDTGGHFSGAGRTRITTPITFHGISTLDGGGTVEFAGGSLMGQGGFDGTGTMEWTGGDVTGKITLGPGTQFKITGDNNKALPGGTLNLAGSTVWTGNSGIAGYGGGQINNSGTFDAQNDSRLSYCCSGDIAQFNNSGVFFKSKGTNSTTLDNFAMNNSGRVEAKTGSIGLSFGTSSGTFATSAGAQIQFASGTHTLADGARFTGSGLSQIKGAVNLAGQTTIELGAVCELAGGTVGGTGRLTGPGTFGWSSGQLTATASVASETTLRLSGDADKSLAGGRLNNFGQITWEGAGALVGWAAGSVTNAGVFEIRNDSSLHYCCSGDIAHFVNLPQGTIRKTTATGATTFDNFLLVNSGRVDIQTGILALTGPAHELDESGHFSGGGRTRIATTVTMNGISTVDAAGTVELLGGTLTGAGTFNGPGTFEWSNGNMSGTVNFGSSAHLNLSSDGSHVITGTVNSDGTTAWTGSGELLGYGGGQFNNRGLFEARSDSIAHYCCSGDVATLHNRSGATFRKLASNGRTVFSDFLFDNDGLVEVLTGTLVLGSGTSSGTFSNAPNAQIEFAGGNSVLNSGGTFTIGGLNQIKPGAVVTLNGSHTIAPGGTFELAGGTLNGAATLSGPGRFLWTSGSLSGQLTISAGTPALISGADNKNVEGGSLLNYGAITWQGTGGMVGWAGGSITNHGVFEIQNDSRFDYCCAGDIARFNNESDGTIRKTVATGTTAFNSFSFYNSGLLDIQSGVLSLNSGGASEIRDGTRLSGAGRTRIDSTTLLTGTATLETGGTLELRGTLVCDAATIAGPGTFDWSQGNWQGTATVAPETTVRVDSDAPKALVGTTLNNDGRILWMGAGGILGYGGAALHNFGTFEVKNSAALSYCCSGDRATFYNEGGLFRKTSDGETAFNSFDFVNSGHLSIQAGTLRLPDGTIIPGVCPVQMPGAVGIDLLPSNNQALLTWAPPQVADGGDNVTVLGFEVQKSADGSAFTTIATLPPGTFQLVVPESCDGPVNSYRVHPLTDGCSAGSSAAVSIPRPTQSPVFLSKPPELAAAEKPFSYNAQAQDPTGAKVTYILVSGPSGMTVDALTGAVQWTPPSALRGQFVPVTIAAFNGACGPKTEQTFSLAIGETPPLGGFKLAVGSVIMSADSLFRLNQVGLQSTSSSSGRRITTQDDVADGTYKLGGDIRINDYLHFDGSVVVTLNRAAATLDVHVDQGKVYLTNIPLIGNKTVWQGGQVSFTVDGNGEVTKLLQDQVQNPLRAAGVDIQIDRAQLLLQGDLGIRLFGKLKFPDVYGVTALSGEFDNLEITQQHGIRFAGQVHLADFELGGMGIRNVMLTWTPNENDPTLDKFEGDGQLITPAFELSVKVVLAGGALDGIGADFNSGLLIGIPVAPPTPFFNITGGGLGIQGLRAGPFSVEGTVDLTLVHPILKNLISLNQVGLKYTYPSSVKMSGDLHILTAKAAQAFLNLDLPYKFGIGGKVKLLDNFPILIIAVDLSAGINPNPASFFVEGGASGTLQIPSYDDFPSAIKSAFPPLILAKPFLPKTLAQASMAYRNGTFSSSIGLPIIGDIVVAVKNVQGQIQLLVGQNLSSLTKVIGLSAFRLNALDAVPQTVGTVTVPSNAPRVIFRLSANSGPPHYSLIQPDGTRLTATAPGTAAYQEVAETKETYFVVPNPAPGNWTIESEDSSKGPFVLDAWGANAPPKIASITAAQNGGEVTINYNAVDPDDNVTVALYYDTDGSGFDGSLIADNLPQSASGTYVWHAAAANLPSGTYSIYAVLDDGKNLPAEQYASGRVTIVDPLAPGIPKNVAARSGNDNSLIVSWDANTETNLQGYIIRYAIDHGAATELTEAVDAGKTNTFRLPRLADNTAYQVAVLAYTQTEGTPTPTQPRLTIHKSLPSDPVAAKTAAANPPVVRVTSPLGGEKLQQNSSITISWQLGNATNVMDQQIDLSTDGGATWRPLVKHLSSAKRNFTWDIPSSLQSSRAQIRVSALDLAGNEAIGKSLADFSISGVDSDGDGIPDAWEIAHGLNPNSKDDAAIDSDGDGATNLQEYLAGTDPKDPASVFRAGAALAANGQIQISVSTVSGKQYQIERTADLSTGTWTVVVPAFTGDGSLKRFNDDTTTAKNRFYRVRIIN